MEVDTCLERLRAHLPELEVRSVETINQGWDSLVLEVNGELIFRFPRRIEIVAQLERERALLPELGPALPLAIPSFLYYGPAGGGALPFVGYRRLSGVPLTAERLAVAPQDRVIKQLADFLAALQCFPVARARQLGVKGGDGHDWRQQYAALFARVHDAVLPLLPARVRPAVADRWRSYLGNEAHFSFQPALLHRDLGSDHILYDPRRGALSAIIDWGDVSVGDPAFDLTGPLAEYGRPFTERLAALLGLDADATLWHRLEFYVHVIPFHEVLYGIEEEKDEHVRQGIARIVDEAERGS